MENVGKAFHTKSLFYSIKKMLNRFAFLHVKTMNKGEKVKKMSQEVTPENKSPAWDSGAQSPVSKLFR